MLGYTLKRLLGAIPTLLILLTLAFFMMRMAPGGPFDSEKSLPPEIQANLDRKYHLDEPLLQQYGRYLWYLWDLLHGDFGPSFQYRDYTVNELIATGFPVSMRLGVTAILIALVIGVALGTVAALRQNRATDYTVMTLAMTGISIPNFVLAPKCCAATPSAPPAPRGCRNGWSSCAMRSDRRCCRWSPSWGRPPPP